MVKKDRTPGLTEICGIPVHFDGWQAVSVSELRPYPVNNRKHGDTQIALLAKSIRSQGWRWGIIVSTRSGYIVAGHARREAAFLMQLDKVPVIYQDFETDEHEKAYRLADNRIAELADIQHAVIAELLEELSADGFDMDLTGYDEDAIAHLLHKEAEEDDHEDPQEAEREALRSKYGVEVGQIWELGEHRVACGSSTDPELVGRLFDGTKPELMVTDPPYGVEYDASWRNKQGLSKATASGVVLNDDNADWRESYALFPGIAAYVWHSNLHADTFAASLRACGFELRSCIIWAKNVPVIGRGNYHWQHEPCWYAVRAGENARFTASRKQTTVWQIEKPKNSETGHSTQKPVECMARPMRNHVVKTVYDPFLGSGTSLIAAENENRTLYAVELNPAYVAVALERWAIHTNKQPKMKETNK